MVVLDEVEAALMRQREHEPGAPIARAVRLQGEVRHRKERATLASPGEVGRQDLEAPELLLQDVQQLTMQRLRQRALLHSSLARFVLTYSATWRKAAPRST